jgi:biopolymer transport protein ExbD/biopolymer transport protein TolR
MPKTGLSKRKQVFSDINITPLTDIFLVLLTIMIIVAPFVRQMRPDINLPEISSGAEVGKDEITIDVTPDGKYFVNGAEVSPDDLTRILQDTGNRLLVKRLVVQADKETKSGAVLRIFRAAEEAQYAQVTVIGQAAQKPLEEKPDETVPSRTVQ